MVAGIVTHYIFLVAFMWMLMEGIQLYRMVVKVFSTNGKSYITHFTIFSYGAPIIGVGVTILVGYLRGDEPYGSDQFCWLNGCYMWAFMGPIAFVIMVNLIILFIALKTSFQLQHSRKIPQKKVIVTKLRSWVKGCFSLTVILGITWAIGFYMLLDTPGRLIASYLFTILNASQGLIMFLLNWHVFTDQLKLLKRRNISTYLPSWFASSFSGPSPSNPSAPPGHLVGVHDNGVEMSCLSLESENNFAAAALAGNYYKRGRGKMRSSVFDFQENKSV